MSASCHHEDDCCAPTPAASQRYLRVLWIALGINAGMFAIEVVAGLAASSVSLQADALDFLGDAANYALSLMVLGLALRWRARAALLKGASMALFGIWVIAHTAYNALTGVVPEAEIMGGVGLMALGANAGVLVLLYAYREGDSNMRSVWLCSRNDVIGNAAVMLAALGVFGTGTGWPDIVVAAIMAGLALSGAWQILRQARGELRHAATAEPSVAS